MDEMIVDRFEHDRFVFTRISYNPLTETDDVDVRMPNGAALCRFTMIGGSDKDFRNECRDWVDNPTIAI